MDNLLKNPPTLKELGYALVEIEVNNQCNMACSFCPLPIRDADDASLELSQIERVLDQIAEDKSVDLVAFHQYNEPLLYPEIWQCLDMAKERGLKTLIVTNGATLTKRNVELLQKHAPTYLRISAQVIKEENHDATRGYKGKFSTYVDNLAKTLATMADNSCDIEDIQMDLAVQDPVKNWRRKLSTLLRMTDRGDPTIFDENPDTLKPSLKGLLEKVDEYSSTFTYDEAVHDQNIAHYNNEPNQAFELAYRVSDKVTISFKQFVNGRRIMNYYPVKYGKCGNWNLGILADGRVVMCCYDYDGFTAMGNIKDEPMESIMSRSQDDIRQLRAGGKFKHIGCAKCMGSPTRHGAYLRTILNFFRFAAFSKNTESQAAGAYHTYTEPKE